MYFHVIIIMKCLSVYITSISQLTKYVFVFQTFPFQQDCIDLGKLPHGKKKTALCFANNKTGLMLYNIYSLEKIQ